MPYRENAKPVKIKILLKSAEIAEAVKLYAENNRGMVLPADFKAEFIVVSDRNGTSVEVTYAKDGK